MKKKIEQNKIVIYKTAKNEVELSVRLEKETAWLSLDQIADLFDRDKSAVSRHIKNIFKEKELFKKSVVANFATTAADGKIYKVDYYNLDVIISVGYRVNSVRATQFRIWATKTLKNYLVRGYSINEKRLLETKEKFVELQNAISFLQEKSKAELLAGQEGEILNLIAEYAKTLSLLEQYDKGEVAVAKGEKTKYVLKYDDCVEIIAKIKEDLIGKGEASNLFGSQRDKNFEGIIGALYQSFGGQVLYPALEDKAAHLLYLIIKDHPFSDGNKRIGSFLFVYFLDKTNSLYRRLGERKINDNALTALALLVAQSDRKEKEIMIKIIKNLITN
jgi:prophage maintenance system killer protein